MLNAINHLLNMAVEEAENDFYILGECEM